jgi:hypothetical protein
VFEDWYIHPVVVRKSLAEDPTTDVQGWAAPVNLTGFVNETVSITRNAAGSEVASTVTINLPLEHADEVNAGSKVELPESQHPDTIVLSVQTIDIGDPDLDGVTVMCE